MQVVIPAGKPPGQGGHWPGSVSLDQGFWPWNLVLVRGTGRVWRPEECHLSKNKELHLESGTRDRQRLGGRNEEPAPLPIFP